MRIQFKNQSFQADAVKAVCDVFNGQPYINASKYLVDMGDEIQSNMDENIGFNNATLKISDERILEQIRKIQSENNIQLSEKLEGKYNITVEMETGVGKTYTYIKTMYELNKLYGFCKFIVVVPSVAIREGVYKSFQMTEEHFQFDYNKKIRYFIYNSSRLTDVETFASDSNINCMIINSQAFNATGKDARRIYMKLDTFRSRRPIDVIAKTNPILIIDEPQSVEGTSKKESKTKEKMTEFNPLFTLRYSATHRETYNMVYRLDAIDAFNQKLVKKIAVKGITVSGDSATEGYVYIQKINISKSAPTASIEFDVKTKTGVKKKTRIVEQNDNLYDKSEGIEEYKEGFVVTNIDGRDNSIQFTNGLKLFEGDCIGAVNEEQLRRIQIRETILSHIEREQELFHRGIKVLSLFFIDEVEKYRVYEGNSPKNGIYADIFEEEYNSIIAQMTLDENYMNYLQNIETEKTHNGYFSVDKGKFINSKLSDKKSKTTNDESAYDLIMKDKERLLSFSEPTRFIFSHSALREGWDNPNVFQICTLKQSSADIRKRQEVGRGLRLCVNQDGVRMDENTLSPSEIHNVNLLTVVASESYDTFARELQSEIAEAVKNRPNKVNLELFKDKFGKQADKIYENLVRNSYVEDGKLTEKYFTDKEKGVIELPTEIAEKQEEIIKILDTVYNPEKLLPDNGRDTIPVNLRKDKFDSKAFKELWAKINAKSFYTVKFDDNELIGNSIKSINENLHITGVYYKTDTGIQAEEISKEDLTAGTAFKKKTAKNSSQHYLSASTSVTYDLIDKLVKSTGLTRNVIFRILSSLGKETLKMFTFNPEEFIIKVTQLIKSEISTAIVEHISYNKLTSTYDDTIFTSPEIKKGKRSNSVQSERSIYDYVVCDSKTEMDFASALEQHIDEVEVYVKLPRGFYINTPIEKYNPDWAIAFYEGKVKHIYFIAETKGTMDSLQLKKIEEAKAHCAKEHFKAITDDNVKYSVVSNYKELFEIVSE